MSENTPGNPGDEPKSEADALDEASEAAMMRTVMRRQKMHREGGVDPEPDDAGADPEPDA